MGNAYAGTCICRKVIGAAVFDETCGFRKQRFIDRCITVMRQNSKYSTHQKLTESATVTFWQDNHRQPHCCIIGRIGVFLSFHLRDDCIGHFAGADGGRVVAVCLHVVGYVLAVCNNGGDCIFEHLRLFGHIEVVEHQYAA